MTDSDISIEELKEAIDKGEATITALIRVRNALDEITHAVKLHYTNTAPKHNKHENCCLTRIHEILQDYGYLKEAYKRVL